MDARAGLWRMLFYLPDPGLLQPQNRPREFADLATGRPWLAEGCRRPLLHSLIEGTPMEFALHPANIAHKDDGRHAPAHAISHVAPNRAMSPQKPERCYAMDQLPREALVRA